MEKKATGIQAFFSPKRILFGIDAIECVAAEVNQFGGKKVLMVTDPGVVEAGLVEAITAPLDSDDIAFSVYDRGNLNHQPVSWSNVLDTSRMGMAI